MFKLNLGVQMVENTAVKRNNRNIDINVSKRQLTEIHREPRGVMLLM